ncbi:hypothetical protein AK830_g6094 [Neonectria ditissima]|uniref:DUF7704 domain-containing protein n=1 Tax=Neonectria ditissima TaxID=78410 RepID=A0A0P7BHQ2_9HYPO|nr:hypothetical protein AK830_g6094 [Neonectria ditissima]
MASSLPTIPRIVFTIVEPISLVAGFLGAMLDPAWFAAEQIPQTEPLVINDNGVVLALELGNLYLLLAFIGLAVLNTTSEVKVVRSYLVALWLGDVGHILFSGYGLGKDKLLNPAEWNAMAWGNVAVTTLACLHTLEWPPICFPALFASARQRLMVRISYVADQLPAPRKGRAYLTRDKGRPFCTDHRRVRVRVGSYWLVEAGRDHLNATKPKQTLPSTPSALLSSNSTSHSSLTSIVSVFVAMESRTLRKRPPPATAPDPSQAPKATRSTRRTATPSVANSESKQAKTAPGRASRSAEPARPNLIARRGARIPAPDRAASIISINTNPPLGDDDTDLGEEDRASEANYQEHVPSSVVDPEEATRYAIMERSLPDLVHTTEELMSRLKDADYDDPIFRGLVNVKKGAFVSARENFEESKTSPLIDWAQALEIFDTEESSETAAAAIVRANMVTALDEVLTLKAEPLSDAFPLLEKLNSWFPSLFVVSREMFEHPRLTLDIRTWYLIEVLKGQKSEPNYRQIIANVFCEPADGLSFPQRFSSGPFRTLGESVDEDLEELCADRISKIIPLIKKDKRTYGVGQLQHLFPFRSLLDDLETWLKTAYALLGETIGRSPSSGEHESGGFIDAEEEIHGSQADAASESQPIVRARTGEEQPSLFSGKASISYLNGQQRNSRTAPPSNQQQDVQPFEAPRDYPEHTNSDLLGSPLPVSNHDQDVYPPEAPRDYPEHTNAELLDSLIPSSSAALLGQDQASGSRPDKKPRYHDPFRPEPVEEKEKEKKEKKEKKEEEEEEEEDDPFETDTRPLKNGKRAAFSSSMPPPPRPKRPRVTPSQPAPTTSSASTNHAARSQPFSSAPTDDDFETLRRAKLEITQKARLPLAPAPKRIAWSNHDSAVLLQLIRQRHAAWANMENYDNDQFEHPRNQQAYRDKARNMKVDYLLTDAILPPCFDLVVLSKKEINRLISIGKNPYRKESEINEEGEAVNTEYDGELQASSLEQ